MASSRPPWGGSYLIRPPPILEGVVSTCLIQGIILSLIRSVQCSRGMPKCYNFNTSSRQSKQSIVFEQFSNAALQYKEKSALQFSITTLQYQDNSDTIA